jgi:hypothetical protein
MYLCTANQLEIEQVKLSGAPKKILEVVRCLQVFPSGLASSEISRFLRGDARNSAISAVLSDARLQATRKQIQRTRHFLIKTNAEIQLNYCKKKRIWRTVHITAEDVP